ncbi:MAG: MBOAT family protein [Clostridia bacterium]|nr:MBOAT family protein [Clostridia bacterium]
MTFNSFEFLIFYPVVALLYYILPRASKWVMLLIASYFFYMYTQPELVLLIFGTTLVSWLSAGVIERSRRPAVRKLFLALTLTVSLGVLFFYKYFDFLSESVFAALGLFGVSADPVSLNLILPVGISFYTFQTLSYVIDVYRGKVVCEKNFFFYALFVSFFPQLVAGPIERPGNLIPQLREAHRPTRENFIRGGEIMLLGFFKKICVADILSIYVTAVYSSPEGATGPMVVLATALFAVQIYCDFSGYTDIATGAARIMGIRLMKNFNHPYLATTVKEFWSRWHISLSTWFRDYLYIPLGGNRVSKPRYAFNIMVVFLVSGLWHGAAWTFVVWGALHGVYQVLGTLTLPARNRLVERLGKSPTAPAVTAVRRTLTFILVCIAWVFFRAGSLSDATTLLSRLFVGWGAIGAALSEMGLDPVGIASLALTLAILFMLDRMLPASDGAESSPLRHGVFVNYIWVVIAAWALLLSRGMESAFIYFRF